MTYANLIPQDEQAAVTIPERADLDPAYMWRLEDLFGSREDWEKAFEETKSLLPSLEAFAGKLSESPKAFLECLKLSDRIGELTAKIYVYAHMKSHEDTRKGGPQSLASRAESLGVMASQAGAFVAPEILAMPAEKIAAFPNEESGFEMYGFFLEEISRQRKHVLSPAEEALLAASGEVAHAPENIFSMLTNADMTFPPIHDEKGNETPFSEERYGIFIQSRDRRVREEAFRTLFKTFGQYRNTLSASLNAAIRSTLFYSRARGFGSNLEASLDGDNIPVSVYDSLVESVHGRLPLLHRYTDLRKRALNIDTVRMYDLYVPMAPEYRQDISFDDAVTMIRESLRPLGGRYLAALDEGFGGGWIDVHENRGKRGGAYCWGSYPTHPFVLLNYNNRLRDVFTVAHEMGHALHKYFSDKKQPFIYAGHSIFIAEVASTTNEALLLEHLLESATCREERLYLLNYRLEQVRTTVFRQTMFAEFERVVHGMVEKGEAPTADTFCSVWRDLNSAYYGPGITLDTEIEMEWSRIPHFYSPFYVFQYATGYSAATALSRLIMENSDTAAERYIRFLERGKSAPAIDVLRDAGVDMALPEPIERTLDVFESSLAEFEELLS
ncbi:MAG: oligoendopeptidase F [Thermovirgaceae bacterium]|nr:oligoendopeptidase F [Thermovirgaceae bacterium]